MKSGNGWQASKREDLVPFCQIYGPIYDVCVGGVVDERVYHFNHFRACHLTVNADVVLLSVEYVKSIYFCNY